MFRLPPWLAGHAGPWYQAAMNCFRALAPILILVFFPHSLTGQALEEVPRPTAGTVEESVYRELTAAHDRVDETPMANPGPRAQAFGELGEIYAAYELWDAATASLANAHRLAGQEFRWAYLLGYASSQRGDLEAAVTSFEQALALDPGSLPARLRLGEAELGRGNKAAARASFEAALALDANSAAAHFGLGRTEAGGGAISSFKRALELDPAASRIHYLLAQAYRREGRADDARRHLAQHGPLRPGFADPIVDGLAARAGGAALHNSRGDQAMLAGQVNEAVAAYRLAVAADPRNFYYRKALGIALYTQDPRQVEAALEHLVEAIDLDPGEGHRKAEKANLHYVLGSMAKNQGVHQVAWTHYQATLGHDEDHVDANFQLGNMLAEQGRFQDALPLYEKGLENAPERSDIRSNYAGALMDLGRFDEALAALRLVLAAEPGNERARYLFDKATEFQQKAGKP